MADQKISTADEMVLASLGDGDVLALVRPGDSTPYHVTVGTLKSYIERDVPFVSVREGGADPASVDNSEAINNLLINMKAEGDFRRVLLDDIYPVQSTVFIDRSQTLEGYAPQQCGLIASAGFDNSVSSWVLRQVRDGVGKSDGVLSGKDRVYLRHITINGNNQAVNGIRAELQQPAHWIDVRVLHCDAAAPYGIGMMITNTVQAQFTNTQIWNCRVGLHLHEATLCWFFGLDVEFITDQALLATSFADWIAIHGWHFEGANSDSTVVWDISGGSYGWTITNAYNGMGNTAGQTRKILYCHDNTSQFGAMTGTFTDIFSDTSPRDLTIVIQDDDRGITLLAPEFGGFNNFMLPAHRYSGTQPYLYALGMNGEYSKLGADGVVALP